MSSVAGLYPDAKHKDSFERGLKFQDFVASELIRQLGIAVTSFCSRQYQYEVGENAQGIEIKLDDWCTRKTGPEGSDRLSIEVSEKTKNNPDAPWVPSGILRKDNTWLYVQGNYERIYLLPKRFLIRYYEHHKDSPGFLEEKMGTIRTFYLPHEIAARWGHVLEVGAA